MCFLRGGGGLEESLGEVSTARILGYFAKGFFFGKKEEERGSGARNFLAWFEELKGK